MFSSAPLLFELERQAWKYQRLVELRQARHSHGTLASQGELRALAIEFPGSLRELDTLSPELLCARAEASQELVRAAGGLSNCPSNTSNDVASIAARSLVEHEKSRIPWIVSYQKHMRRALALKRALAGNRQPSVELVEELRLRLASRGEHVDAEFVRRVASPPQGRLNAVVFASLSEELGVAPELVREGLFPRTLPRSELRSAPHPPH